MPDQFFAFWKEVLALVAVAIPLVTLAVKWVIKKYRTRGAASQMPVIPRFRIHFTSEMTGMMYELYIRTRANAVVLFSFRTGKGNFHIGPRGLHSAGVYYVEGNHEGSWEALVDRNKIGYVEQIPLPCIFMPGNIMDFLDHGYVDRPDMREDLAYYADWEQTRQFNLLSQYGVAIYAPLPPPNDTIIYGALWWNFSKEHAYDEDMKHLMHDYTKRFSILYHGAIRQLDATYTGAI